jgi:hypothetical protein
MRGGMDVRDQRRDLVADGDGAAVGSGRGGKHGKIS